MYCVLCAASQYTSYNCIVGLLVLITVLYDHGIGKVVPAYRDWIKTHDNIGLDIPCIVTMVSNNCRQ